MVLVPMDTPGVKIEPRSAFSSLPKPLMIDSGSTLIDKVYTDYLDMRATDDDTAPTWTLQYAVLQPTPDPSGGMSNPIHGVPTPP